MNVAQPTARTPGLKDKRLWFGVGSVAALLLTAVFRVPLSGELIAGVVSIVLGVVTNSAVKEALVSRALIQKDAP